MIDGFIKRLKNRESLWRRVKKSYIGNINECSSKNTPPALRQTRPLSRWKQNNLTPQSRN